MNYPSIRMLSAGAGLVAYLSSPASLAQARSVESVASFARASVVVIECAAGRSMGSGFAIGDGDLLATNAHVVEGCETVSLRGDQGQRLGSGQVAYRDTGRDIAIVHLAGTALPSLSLREGRVPVGREVIALGHPAGFEYTVSTGIVSAVRELSDTLTLIQTTAPISPGSSGGPLLDHSGQVIAMNTLTFVEAQNLNMAVSAVHVKEAAERARLRLGSQRSSGSPSHARGSDAQVVATAHELRLEGKLDEAARTLDLAGDQRALALLQQRAEIAWDRQDHPEAERLVQLMLSIDPNYPPAHQSRGVLLMQRERNAEGCAAQRQAIELGADPEYRAYAEAVLAECALLAEDSNSAIEHLSRALQHPTIARHPTAHGQLAALLAEAGRTFAAHAAALRALELTDESQLGSAFEFLGRYGLPLAPEISNGTAEWTAAGFLEVRGIVLNASPDVYENLTVLVESLDEAGAVVGSGSAPLSNPRLQPGTSGSFHVRVGGMPEQGVRWEARIVY